MKCISPQLHGIHLAIARLRNTVALNVAIGSSPIILAAISASLTYLDKSSVNPVLKCWIPFLKLPMNSRQPKRRGAGPTKRDLQAAKKRAEFEVLVGRIRRAQIQGYIRGWLNRGFYK